MKALDPFDAVQVALLGISAATWTWLASYWITTRKTQGVQLPIDDSQSVSSTDTNVDKLEDEDIPVEIEKWTRRVNRQKIAYAMSALASVGCNVAALGTAQTVDWRNVCWLCYWFNLLILAIIWRMTTPTSVHWPMTVILACLPLIGLAETVASILLRPTAGLYGPALHEVLPGLWTSTCFVIAMTIDRAPPNIVQSPYTYETSNSKGSRIVSRASSSLASFTMFSWMRPTLLIASRGDDAKDYARLPTAFRGYALFEAWKKSCAASLPKDEKPAPGDIDIGHSPFPRLIGRLQWRILVCNARTSIIGAGMECVLAGLRYGPAWSIKHFLEVFEESGKGAVSRRLAWAWLLMIVTSMLARSLLQAQTYANWNCINTPSIRAQLNAALYQKTLRLRDQVETEANDNSKIGKRAANIMSLFSTDTQRAAEAVNRWVELLACRPIELVVSGYLLYDTLGTAGFVGVLVPLALIPVTQYFVRKLGRDQAVLMQATDAQLSITNEMLQSIKFIKFMAFEKVCEDRILAARENELAALRRVLNDKVCIDTMGVAGPMLSLFIAFAVYTKIEQRVLTASVAFSSILVMEQLRFALASMMATTFTIIQARNALSRLESYLEQESLDHVKTDVLERHGEQPKQRTRTGHAHTTNVTLKNASFAWSTAHLGFRLSEVSATFSLGLNLICGQIGAGKTLLLRGLLGEASLVEGQSFVDSSRQKVLGEWLDGSIAYAPQAPWLMNGSIRDNTLFGLPLQEPRYSETIAACGLSPDLLIFEDGDLTEIGEKGVILSGGQKARVSLARAIYSRASVVMLDDPLSAVDSHTGKHIFDECLCGPLASGRTILLVSHALHLCAPAAVQVLHLEAGRVAFCGSGEDYLKTELYAAATNQSDALSGCESEDTDARSDTLVDTSAKSPESLRTISAVRQKRDVTQVVKAETKTKAGSELSIWLYWFKLNGGISFAICILAVFLGGKGVWLLRDRWVGLWTDRNAASKDPLEDANFNLAIMGLLSSATIVVLAARFPVTFIGSRRVSRTLYRDMLHAVLRSPMRFFDTALLGSLLNRFGRDVEVIDVDLAPSAGDVLNSICGYTMVLVTVGMVSPLMAVTMLPLLTLAYFHFGRFFLAASSELRKLDALHKSPLFGLYSETNAGLDVIRAYKRAPQFMLAFLQKLDQAQLFYVLTWYANRWLSVRFDLVSTAFTTLVGVAALLSPSSLVSPGFAGFAIYITIRASGDVFWVTRHLTSTQMGLTSVERCKEYSELPAEAPEVVEPRPSAAWPSNGTIEVRNLSVRYAPGLPKVLKNVSFTVRGGEKVGIVGATGSGKTTLSIALFRFVEADEGAITIDGLDIAKIGVSDLRSQLCIVPQDPTVLSGTLRSTLDPLKVGYTDKQMYDALKGVHLIRDGQDTPEEGAVSQHQQFFRNLDSHISEQGKNLSAGEKQLVCMARAILKGSKIVICDEATSSLDQQTDRLVTQTISEGFEGSTMLVIAHRLRTVIEFDKILVMHEGTVAEYDTPANLLSDSNSRFYALCQAAGPQEFASLQQICGAGRS